MFAAADARRVGTGCRAGATHRWFGSRARFHRSGSRAHSFTRLPVPVSKSLERNRLVSNLGDLSVVQDLYIGTEVDSESLVGDEPDWHERALCAQTDPEAFFPEKGGSTREAKKICTGCEVRSECLSYALANDERFGIWGGLSERERRRLKRNVG
jgi:WhiB family transcriptional regulator, redox-sensing transcriptional regulator